MKVLICHNSYRQPGGEDAVVEAEFNLLDTRGVHVEKYIVSNQTISGLNAKLKTGISANYSTASKKNLGKKLDGYQPDIVHFHNTFPLLTPSVYDACRERDIPCIQTLHNYRLTCAGALLMRDNTICELCVQGSPWQGAKYRCYRGSFVQSLAAARLIAHHRQKNTWNRKVNGFIALTEFSRQKFIQAGIDAQKIRVKPNFVHAPAVIGTPARSDFAVYVGRISTEKGCDTLVQSFNDTGIPIKIVGEGPDRPRLENISQANIEWLGHLPHDDVVDVMRRARFLVMPSQCYETFGRVIIEAFSQSLPVLCSGIGAMKELVTDGATGSHFTAGDVADLSKKSQRLYRDAESCLRMGAEAYRIFQQQFTADMNYRALMDIYKCALEA